ncbi:hypothetical protein [Caldifermentibacillus hisashii]|uniref:hypothetical protein n=1 Tax=Caldifermentibacillus hisashii TaxID=996558 RepID=UPI00341EEC8C
MLNFDDETRSRHHFEVEKAHIWRRDPFSSPFLSEKSPILTTSPILVATLK